MADIENVSVEPEAADNENQTEVVKAEEQNEAVVEEQVKPAEEQNEAVTVEEQGNSVEEQKPSVGKKVLAAVKEWFRKRIVALKRSPQSIVLFALFVTTALWLIWLFTFSRNIDKNNAVEWCGLVVFVNTLVSVLIIALFGSAFPKRKKANIVFIVLLFVFMAILITCDVLYYVEMDKYLHASQADGGAGYLPNDFAMHPYMEQSLTLAIAHIVLVGIDALLLATLPLYKKLINKINTRKVVESTEIKEVIDVED